MARSAGLLSGALFPVVLFPVGLLVVAPLVGPCLRAGCRPVGRWPPVGLCLVLLLRLSRLVVGLLLLVAGCRRLPVGTRLPGVTRLVAGLRLPGVFPLVGPLLWGVAGSRLLLVGLRVGAAVAVAGVGLPRTPAGSSSPMAGPAGVMTFAGRTRSAPVR
ncbi:hypothetical protein [Saccharothrix sp. Mg75]|uniref:hypothetical protein n=1 Tax=Saccharothrix sp. Mg75 TaxID=3445357 RepID=UPI003EED3B35